jgi:4-hydroxy-3-polyprenylbenzoate decarboxylase
MRERRYVVALTGASGAVYGRRLVECLALTGATVHLVVSEAAAKVVNHELGFPLDVSDGAGVARAFLGEEPANLRVHHYKDLEQAIASGSYAHDGMAICPCSTGTLGRIASGASTNLIERAADVCLKERRRLVLVPRETPLSQIHIQNMLTLTQAGAIVLPASPGFYAKNDSVERLVDFVVSRVLDHLGVENALMQRYGEPATRKHPEDE